MGSANNSLPQPPRQDPTQPWDYLIRPGFLNNFPSCASSFSIAGQEFSTGNWYLISVNCKRWGCSFCARQKIRRLSWLTHEAQPNRLLTLTTDHKLYPSPREAWEATAPQVPELFRHLRKRFGEFEYLKVTELCKDGYPHYHALARSAYIPQPVIKAWWEAHTGATIVDVRQVKQSFSAYNYLVKYLTKMHRLDWTERHVAYSRNFFRSDTRGTFDKMELVDKSTRHWHPHTFLDRIYTGQVVTQVRPGVWLLPEPPDNRGLLTAHDDADNANADWPTEPPKVQQSLLSSSSL